MQHLVQSSGEKAGCYMAGMLPKVAAIFWQGLKVDGKVIAIAYTLAEHIQAHGEYMQTHGEHM